jgi:hypothetical protein
VQGSPRNDVNRIIVLGNWRKEQYYSNRNRFQSTLVALLHFFFLNGKKSKKNTILKNLKLGQELGTIFGIQVHFYQIVYGKEFCKKYLARIYPP